MIDEILQTVVLREETCICNKKIKTKDVETEYKKMPPIEPFIRWAGGKTWLIPYVQKMMNNIRIEHYHEPFLGGGAIYFSIDHSKKAYLSDANEQLINTYIQVRDNPKKVIEILKQMPSTKENYYKIRSEFTKENSVENAARFIYLNQNSYNGLYRVNRSGNYNVPYGFREKIEYDTMRIEAASIKLKKARIEVGDFEINKYRIKENDLVFLDPPYTVSHKGNGFISYNQKLFSLDDQKRLKRYVEYIKKKGAYYILTNAAHENIQEIFLTEGNRMVKLQRNSLIGGKNAVRTAVTEFVFTNIPEVCHE